MVFSSHILPPWYHLCLSASFLFPLYQIPFIFTLLNPICFSGPRGEPVKSCTSFLCSLSLLSTVTGVSQASNQLRVWGSACKCFDVFTSALVLCRLWGMRNSHRCGGMRRRCVYVCVWDRERHFLWAIKRCVIIWGICKIAGAMYCIKDYVSHHGQWCLAQFKFPSDA